MTPEHQPGLTEVLLVVAFSSLFSIGGGNGPLAIIQDRWVATGLLAPPLFAWAIALGHLSPGPKSGFLAGIGYYMAGWPGALAAVLGIVLPTWLACAGVSRSFRRLEPVIRRIGLPATFVVAGMIAAAAWDLARPMELTVPEMLGAGLVTVLIAWRNVEPALVVLAAAGLGPLWWLVQG